jgi:recombination protein RecA
LREKIGVMFGSPETTTGGRALKFYSSTRLDIRRIETLKEGQDAVGNRVRVKVVKNKVSPPFRQSEFDIIYGRGISWAGSVLDVGLEHQIVEKSGSYFSFGDDRLGQGRANARAFLEEHPDILNRIVERIEEVEGVQITGGGRDAELAPPTADAEAAEDTAPAAADG